MSAVPDLIALLVKHANNVTEAELSNRSTIFEGRKLEAKLRGLIEVTKDADSVTVKFAIACAERVLPLFAAEFPEDKRPQDALTTSKITAANRALAARAAAYAVAKRDSAAEAAAWAATYAATAFAAAAACEATTDTDLARKLAARAVSYAIWCSSAATRAVTYAAYAANTDSVAARWTELEAQKAILKDLLS